MVSKALRMNASSSPRGTVQPASPRMRKTARSPPGSPSTPRAFQRRLQPSKNVEFKKKTKKYIHVHHYKQTNLFGAWFNDPSKPGKKKRLFFGSHITAYLAARAQDRAALKYKPYALDPSSIKLNFKEEDYVADEKLRKLLTCEEFGKLLRKESRPKYTKMEHTPCLRQFMDEEMGKGNIPDEFVTAVYDPEHPVMPLKQYLRKVISDRGKAVKAPAVSFSDKSNVDQESSDEDFEEPVPTARTAALKSPKPRRLEHDAAGAKVERKKRSVLRRNKPSETPVPTVAKPKSVKVDGAGLAPTKRTGHSEPLQISPVPAVAEPKSLKEGAGFALVWGRKGRRSRRSKRSKALGPGNVTKFKPAGTPRTKLQNKLHKVNLNSKSREPAPTVTESLLPAVEKSPGSTPDNTKSSEPSTETESLRPAVEKSPASMPDNTKSSEPSPIESEGLPVEVEITQTREPSAAVETEGLPLVVELPIRNKWQFKLHKMEYTKTTNSSATGSYGVPSPSVLEALAAAAVAKLSAHQFTL